MATLHIHLRDGFEGDAVVIHVAGREAYRNPAVRTRTQVGLADLVEVPVPDGEVQVEIRLPERGLERTVVVTVDGSARLGVWIEDGRLEAGEIPEDIGYA